MKSIVNQHMMVSALRTLGHQGKQSCDKSFRTLRLTLSATVTQNDVSVSNSAPGAEGAGQGGTCNHQLDSGQLETRLS